MKVIYEIKWYKESNLWMIQPNFTITKMIKKQNLIVYYEIFDNVFFKKINDVILVNICYYLVIVWQKMILDSKTSQQNSNNAKKQKKSLERCKTITKYKWDEY